MPREADAPREMAETARLRKGLAMTVDCYRRCRKRRAIAAGLTGSPLTAVNIVGWVLLAISLAVTLGIGTGLALSRPSARAAALQERIASVAWAIRTATLTAIRITSS